MVSDSESNCVLDLKCGSEKLPLEKIYPAGVVPASHVRSCVPTFEFYRGGR